MSPLNDTSKAAFSLVELSIVLVILGLLTGGILAGQSLIRAAELRSIITESQKHMTAIHAFRDKYFAIPGDMSTATNFWGISNGSTGNDAACRNHSSTGQATCNGNGDGRINTSAGSNEDMRFWQHLANAGLLEGTYNGVGSNGGTSYFGSAPISRSDATTYWVPWFYNAQTATSQRFEQNLGNNITLMRDPSVGDNFFVRPEEAWNIDMKQDDGIPNKGKIISNKGSATNPCSTRAGNVSDVDAAYNLSHTGVVCYMVWAQLF